MAKSRLLIVACILTGTLLFPEFSAAQIPLYNHSVKFSTAEGLPQNYIIAIAQDQDGFMWFSTPPNGLVRFDGHEFLNFSYNPSDNSGLSFTTVHDIVIDKTNTLWMVYFNGKVDRMDPRTFQVTRNIKPVMDPDTLNSPFSVLNDFSRDWTVDATGLNWFYSYQGKLMVYDTSQVRLADAYHERAKEDSLLYAFTEDDNHKLWLLTDKGLEVSDKSWKNFRKINYPSMPGVSIDSSLSRNIVPLSGNRMVTAIGDRLMIYHEDENSFHLVKIPPVPRLRNKPVRCMTRDHSGRVLFTYQGYVFRLEADDTITTLWKCPGTDYVIIASLFIDRTNTLWVGTNGYGLYKINLLVPGFESQAYTTNLISDILEYQMFVPPENIPFGWKRKMEKQFWLRYYYDRDGTLYISNKADETYGGREIVYKLSGKRLIPLPNRDVKEIVGLSGNRSGDLWALAAEAFLYHWTDTDTEPAFAAIPTMYSDSMSIGAFDLLADDHNLWIATKYNGLYQLRNNQVINRLIPSADTTGIGKFQLTQLANDPVNPDILWIGTLGGGLIRWDKTRNMAAGRLTMKDGLPNNNITGLFFDRRNIFWICTESGLCRYDELRQDFTNYTITDGLFENDLQLFFHFALPDGRFAVGGLNGYSVFDPGAFNTDTCRVRTGLTRLLVNKRPVDFSDENSILTGPINRAQRIDLRYNQNNIELNIVALEYNHPAMNRYRYRLEGYDREWIDNGNNNRISYSNLPYGKYTLAMNASNTSGIWSPEIRSLVIHIHPPFWLTWWAFVIYALLVFTGIRAYRNYYTRKLRKQHELEFNRREASRLKEMDEMKTRFFSNITHEFRTPLTLILSPLQKHLNDNSLSTGKATELLQNNYRHAGQLLKLVNQLLDISKLEAGQMVNHDTVGDLAAFVGQCTRQFSQEAEAKGIHLKFTTDVPAGQYKFDQSMWEKIIFNLLSNAIKFTPGGSITVELFVIRDGDNEIETGLTVRDTGIGIPEKILPKIFERFYQVDDSQTRTYEGTGIGLALVRELVDLMKGDVTVESQEGKGTTFRIRLMVRKSLTGPDGEEDFPEITGSDTTTEENIIHEPDDNLPLILVVEDNAELRSFIAESLSAQWRVIQADNGIQAWELVERELPEIVVSDIMMPGMNGLELCGKSKENPLTNHVSFILLTAKASQEARVSGLEAGADEYISKPFHPYELELRIRNLLRQQERLRIHLVKELFPEKPDKGPGSSQDAFISSIYKILEQNLDNPAFSTEDIATAMASSKSTLNRKLKALLNISSSELVRQYRLQRSVELIRSGYRMSEIAYAVGFESPSYFARCFKEQFKTTPTEFAKNVI